MTATSPQQTDTGPPPPPPEGPTSDQSHLPAQGLARASAIMAAGTLVSRVLGFVRTALLAVAIGNTTLVADIFEKSNTIPNVVYLLLAGGMFNVVLVPQLIKAARRPDRGADYTSRLLTLTIVVLAAFAVLITLAAYPIIATLTRGWTEPMLALGTAFAVWTLPQIFFYGLYAVTGQVLNANARFGWYMWAPVLNNVIAIGVIISFIITFGQYSSDDNQLTEWTAQQTIWLAAGHTVGIIAQAALLLWPLSRLGLRLRPKFGLKGMGLASTGKIAGWTLVTMLIGNLANLAYMRLISGATAARQDLGQLSSAVPGETAANVAELIAILPHSVFVLSIATVLFNQLARAMDLGRYGRAREIINEGLRIFAIPVMFCMVAVLVLAGQLGRIFAGSAADANLAGAAIGQLLVLLALGMPFRSASFYLMRVFYSAEDAKTPMMIYAIIAVVGLTTAYGLATVVPEQDIAYLVIGLFSALHILQYLICHLLVVRRWGGFDFASVLSAYLRSGACAAVAGAAGAGTLWLLGGYSWGFAWESIFTAVVSCAVVGVVMALVYVLMLRALKVDEFTAAIAPLARRIPALSRLAR
ncbi:murein biosynthesis integral membrane protein MurJ [Nesterenkonia halotolerans]|uniref:Peptidoglycan lipid II flippase n=1 Tax=Nesterenkonia halotolerans TaxID=225325 RepID=A0ABR9J7L4_9MICC|nr:lipid II flippase MurJ [Nesterenkonia halotolerans]MBE1514980.1 putative peptidoglycan lipid II flippase [Nesterenkonia halotolerans]